MTPRPHKITGRGLAHHLGLVVDKHQAAHAAARTRVREAIGAAGAATQSEPEAGDNGPVSEG